MWGSVQSFHMWSLYHWFKVYLHEVSVSSNDALISSGALFVLYLKYVTIFGFIFINLGHTRESSEEKASPYSFMS